MQEEKIEELRKSLIVSQEKEFLDLLGKLKGILKIDSVAGPVVGSKTLAMKEKIQFYLIGLKAAKILGVETFSEGTVTISELRMKLGITEEAVRSYLSMLSRENKAFNLIKGGKGKKAAYAITDFGIQDFRERILPKLTSGVQNEK